MFRSSVVALGLVVALVGGFVDGCGGEYSEPQGRIRLTVSGLVEGHKISAAAVETRPVFDLRSDPKAVIQFTDVGNGTYSLVAPAARSYEYFCGFPPGLPDRYDVTVLDPRGSFLRAGGTLDFSCAYVERALITFVFTGLDETIAGEWAIATITGEPSGSERAVQVEQSGEGIRVRPGRYEFGCNGLVGSGTTNRFVLTSISTTGATLGPGESVTVTCLFEPA